MEDEPRNPSNRDEQIKKEETELFDELKKAFGIHWRDNKTKEDFRKLITKTKKEYEQKLEDSKENLRKAKESQAASQRIIDEHKYNPFWFREVSKQQQNVGDQEWIIRFATGDTIAFPNTIKRMDGYLERLEKLDKKEENPTNGGKRYRKKTRKSKKARRYTKRR